MKNLAAIEVYTTNEVVMAKAVENKGFLSSSKVETVKKEDVAEFPKIIKQLQQDLIHELREKALKLNANAIVGLNIEINPLFDGVFNVLVYGSAVSF